MPHLINVCVYPSESNPHSLVGMLIDPNPDWIKTQLKRIENYAKIKEDDSNLAFLEYWGGYFHTVDVYDLEDHDQLAELLEDNQSVEINEERAQEIKDFENTIRLDANTIVIDKDGIHMSGSGKHNDLKYESEEISESDLREMLNKC